MSNWRPNTNAPKVPAAVLRKGAIPAGRIGGSGASEAASFTYTPGGRKARQEQDGFAAYQDRFRRERAAGIA